MDTKHKLALSTAPALVDPSSYRRLIGQLIYLTVTRPDLTYSVHILNQFMVSPTDDHLQAAHRVLRYLKMPPTQGLFYPSDQELHLTTFCDVDWGACPITRRSVTGYSILLGTSLITWKTKKQPVVSKSLAEAEYRAMAQTSCELAWLVCLLSDFQITVSTPIPLYCDSNAAMHIARNPIFHERTKHVELDCHIVRQYITSGLLYFRFIKSIEQPADLFTKPLSADHLSRLSSKLNVSNLLHMLSLKGVMRILSPIEFQARLSN
ncbi:unnamed protein product [Rhodiola kirilowii]